MRKINKVSVVLLMSLIFFCMRTALSHAYVPPVGPYNIVDFGAKGDGNQLNTTAIQRAIDKAFSDGGGSVIVPEGVFLSGSVMLKSNVELHLHRKAILLGSASPFDYTRIKGSMMALILSDGARNISITGDGTIDGQGRELGLCVDSLYHAGVIEDASYSFFSMRPSEHVRPMIINFIGCKNVQVAGITIKNAAGWVQTYELCDTVIIDKISVESIAYWNNDGIDITDCKNVRITDCFVNSADDGICLKSSTGTNMCEDVYIANCTVRSSASAIKLGTASKGGFKNVTIENIVVYDTYRSAIALQSVDGGLLENIKVSNIRAINTGNAFFIRLGHRNKKGPVGKLRNVSIKNVFVEVPFERPDERYDLRGPALAFFHNPIPASITGIPGHKIEGLTLEDITIIYPGRSSKGLANIPINRLADVPEQEADYPEFSMFRELPAWGLYVRHVKDLTMKNIRIQVKEEDFRPAIVFDDVMGLNVYNSTISPTNFNHGQIVLNNVQEAIFQGTIIEGMPGDGVYSLQSDYLSMGITP